MPEDVGDDSVKRVDNAEGPEVFRPVHSAYLRVRGMKRLLRKQDKKRFIEPVRDEYVRIVPKRTDNVQKNRSSQIRNRFPGFEGEPVGTRGRVRAKGDCLFEFFQGELGDRDRAFPGVTEESPEFGMVTGLGAEDVLPMVPESILGLVETVGRGAVWFFDDKAINSSPLGLQSASILERRPF